MNSNQKDGAATLVGILSILFILAIIGGLFGAGFYAGRISQPAPATSTYAGLTAFQWSQVAHEKQDALVAVITQRNDCMFTYEAFNAPYSCTLKPTSTDAESGEASQGGLNVTFDPHSYTDQEICDQSGFCKNGLKPNTFLPESE
jgi:hypothetical protein